VSAEHAGTGPVLRVVHGAPTAEEIAALVAVLAAASGAAAEPQPAGPSSQWAPPARLHRAPVAPTGWWESSLPR
jgi:hypothetical protein